MAIECELRAFISKEKYHDLLRYFHREGKFVCRDEQETHYLNHEEDIRLQRSTGGAKVWLKKGKLHDALREEIQVHCRKEDFTSLQRVFSLLGMETAMKWLRERHTFTWQGISVMVDHTEGYGYIIELEKMCDEEESEAALEELHQ